MTTNQAPTKPEPLSIYVLHTPEERRRHAIEVAAYNDYIRGEEQRQRTIEQTKIAVANRILSDDDYFQAAVQRKAEQDARDVAREAERQAAADAKAVYLASMPDVAEIVETNPVSFIQQVMHWTQHGYTMPDSPDLMMLPNFYKLSLNKPEAPAKKQAK